MDISARNLVCYSRPEGEETKDCDQTRGFKTCFTRYSGGKYNKARMSYNYENFVLRGFNAYPMRSYRYTHLN